MAVAGFGPTQFSFASCISACSGSVALDVGRQFHSLMIKAGFGGDVYVGSSVVDMYATCGNIEDSICAFHGFNNPTIVTYNTMLSGLAQHGRAGQAIQIFKELEKTETAPNKTTFIYFLTACSHVGLLQESMFFFDVMCDHDKIEPESEHYLFLVDVLRIWVIERILGTQEENGKYWTLDLIKEMVEKGIGPTASPSIVSITSLYEARLLKEACDLLVDMRKRGVCPNVKTYTGLIPGLFRVDYFEIAIGLFHKMLQDSVVPNTVTYNALLHGLWSDGKVGLASTVFDKMTRFSCMPNAQTHKEMIKGSCL
ncbi:pentatricopeptide repeat-containing protein At2g33680-like [Aristolochia californica]|uniref:pentatricopeptide repeat-containing protein At2g33680-like n=1 Tax=Aristolochia californica TaxID=171875 RepID=UPI0035D799CD